MNDHYETACITQEGRLTQVSITASPIRDAQGNTTGTSIIARDINERKQAELSLALQQASEARSLERLTGAVSTQVTAQVLGLAPLRESAPALFGDLVQQYVAVMDQAVLERTYKIKHDIPASLRAIADRLGQSNAGPRDVVEMHAAALRNRLAALPQQSRAYAEEGRLLALELMGHLAAFYRNHAMGARRPARNAEPAPGE